MLEKLCRDEENILKKTKSQTLRDENYNVWYEDYAG